MSETYQVSKRDENFIRKCWLTIFFLHLMEDSYVFQWANLNFQQFKECNEREEISEFERRKKSTLLLKNAEYDLEIIIEFFFIFSAVCFEINSNSIRLILS